MVPRRPLWLARISATQDHHGSAMRRGLRGGNISRLFCCPLTKGACSFIGPQRRRPGVEPGLTFLSDQRLVLEAEGAAELPVQARADHREVIAIATAVAEANELVVNHRSAGVRHADHVTAPEGAIGVTVTIKADVQTFDLRGHVVEAQEAAREGVLDAAAHREPEVIIPIAVTKEAEAGI